MYKMHREYIKFVDHLSDRVTGEVEVDKLIERRNKFPDSYRTPRMLRLALLKDKEKFWYYYGKREELGLKEDFDIIFKSILEHTNISREIKEYWKESFYIDNGYEGGDPDGWDVESMDKDISSFYLYWRKNYGDLKGELEKIKEERGVKGSEKDKE